MLEDIERFVRICILIIVLIWLYEHLSPETRNIIEELIMG